jgi:hypothetical protein
MALTFKPVEHMPGSAAGESKDLFVAFLEAGIEYAVVEGATNKDRSRLQSASTTFNRNRTDATVKVRARGDQTYLQRVPVTQE